MKRSNDERRQSVPSRLPLGNSLQEEIRKSTNDMSSSRSTVGIRRTEVDNVGEKSGWIVFIAGTDCVHPADTVRVTLGKTRLASEKRRTKGGNSK